MDEQTVVVGGGLAGLTAAALVAAAGRPVTVVEARPDVGGRAATTTIEGFRFNLGPHALYLGGQGAAVLRQLGVHPTGSAPNPLTSDVLVEGQLLSPAALTRRLTWRARRQVAAALAGLAAPGARRDDATTAARWVADRVDDAAGAAVVHALIRLGTYVDAPDRLAVSVAADRQRAGLRGVRYVDGGWQTLADGLRDAALRAGARIVHGTASAVEHDDRVRAVVLADGTQLPATAVVVAAGDARRAARLLAGGPAGEAARGWAAAAEPFGTACLDVGLRSLPQPERTFALGIDTPLYLSVHSRWARLAPAGAAVVLVARPATDDSASDRAELEAALDIAQPGWRDRVVTSRFLPDLAAVSWLATTDRGGLAGRPPVAVPGVRGLALAGDWVGPDGWLADASFASAVAAADVALEAGQPARAA